MIRLFIYKSTISSYILKKIKSHIFNEISSNTLKNNALRITYISKSLNNIPGASVQIKFTKFTNVYE